MDISRVLSSNCSSNFSSEHSLRSDRELNDSFIWMTDCFIGDNFAAGRWFVFVLRAKSKIELFDYNEREGQSSSGNGVNSKERKSTM